MKYLLLLKGRHLDSHRGESPIRIAGVFAPEKGSVCSSFGEEVVLRVAATQENKITVLNANNVVSISLKRIIEDTNVMISFES